MPPAGAVDENVTIYMFSPETNVNNYYALKSEFDDYFANKGRLKLQPFIRRSEFEKVLSEKRPGLYLMSSWHCQQWENKDGLCLLLVGTNQGKVTQRHCLFTRRTIQDVLSLRNQTVATAGSKSFARNKLAEMLGVQLIDIDLEIPNIKWLEVPKDIDALMAVTLGMAGAAVATERSVKVLEKANPLQSEKLTKLVHGPPSLLPVLVGVSESQFVFDAAVQTLTEMGEHEEGRRRLRMLGLDGFQVLDKTMVEAFRE